MIEKPAKRKYRKQIIFLIIFFIIILIRAYLNSPYTHVEERKIINYALQGSRRDFKIHWDYLNNDTKAIRIMVLKKHNGDANQIVEIRSRMNNYLKNNPDYFLNNNYEIALNWAGNRSGGPKVLEFSNVYPTNYSGSTYKHVVKFDYLDCLYILDSDFGYKIDDITDFTLYEDIKALVLEDYVPIGNIEILENFKSLEFFKPNNMVTDEDLEIFRTMFPDCEIYGR